MSKPTLVFFGNERLATSVSTDVPVLKSLIAEGYDIAAVISSHERATSRKIRPLEIGQVTNEHKIKHILPAKLSNLSDELKSYGADAGILVAYGKIVPESIINLFPRGIINIHPSLLPLHRGPTPLESVILSGENETGVSLMQLAKEMDAGAVYAQKTVPLNGNESKQELADTLLLTGKNMLLKSLPAILDGSLQPVPQDDAKATYDQLIQKQDGAIDWNKPARQLEREVRAYLGWPGSRTQLFNQDITILEANINDTTLAPGETNTFEGKLLVGTGEKSLEITKLRPAGRSSMSASDFLRGLRGV